MNKTPFCNMCFKAGKPASEYKSHWLRDKPGKGGVVVCPYLLSIECRYCHEKGHTMGQCPILKKRKVPRQKYDVSGLPPMPTKLRPLVMPVRSGVEANTETLAAARSVWVGGGVGAPGLPRAGYRGPERWLCVPRSGLALSQPN